MEVKLGTHVYFSVSMITIDKKLPWELFPIISYSLLKLTHHAMHGGETWYTCVFQSFQGSETWYAGVLHVSMTTMTSGTFPNSSLLKLANHTMHGSETWYTCVFQRFHDNHDLGHFSL